MTKTGIVLVVALACAASAELLVDGDFEAPDSSAWLHVTAPWGANYLATTEASPGVPGEAAWLGWIPAIPGQGSQALLQTFTVSATTDQIDVSWDWATYPAGGAGGVNGWYEVLLLPGDGATWDGPAPENILAKEEYGFGNPFPAPHGAWQPGSVTGISVTPGGQYTIALKVGGSPATSNQAFFDNVSVIPEPGFLLLGGFAGLAVCIRRRRR